MMKRIFAVLLAVAMLLSVSAAFAETAAEEAAAETVSVPDTLLATVNGKEIRENNEALQGYLADMMSEDAEEDEEYLHLVRMYAMMYVLQRELIDEKAAAAFTEEEAEEIRQTARDEWNEIVGQICAQHYGITDASTEEEKADARANALAMLEAYYGYTEESYADSAISGAFAEKVTKELKETHPDLAATEEEIEQAYNDLVAEEMEGVGNDAAMYEYYQAYQGYQFHYIPEGYRGILHILLKVDQALLDNWTDLRARLEETGEEAEDTGDSETAENPEETGDSETAENPEETKEPVTAEMVEAARQEILNSQKEKIDAIMERLEKGEAFEDLIAEYGEDDGMKDEENLKNGYSVHADGLLLDADFTKGAVALEKIGDVSDPVISQFGIHILYYLRDIPAGPLEMTDDDREEMRANIEEERLNLAISDLLDQWVEEADIVWTAEGEAWKFDQAVVDAYNEALDEGSADDDSFDE